MNNDNNINKGVTDFPMKGNLKKLEKENIKKWKEKNIYKIISKKYKGKKRIIIHDGPPYANGGIHMGHILNKTIKDCIIKKKFLEGYSIRYKPGWDCHGTPIEVKFKQKIEGENFIKVRRYVKKQIEKQRKEFKSLGTIINWDKYYKTMSYKTEFKEAKLIIKLIEQGRIIRKKKALNYCMQCKTAISDYETNKKIMECPTETIKYKINSKYVIIINIENYYKLKANNIIIRDNIYMVENKERKILVIESQLKLLKKYKIIKKIDNIKKIIKKNKTNKLIIKKKSNNKNKVEAIFKLEKKVIKKNEKITIKKEAEICWRHKTRTVKVKKKELFLKDEDREGLIKKIKKESRIYPKKYKESLINTIRNKPIWNISRSKKWGVPIPLIKKNGKIIVLKKAIKKIKKKGIESWSRAKAKKGYKKINKVVDVWFDSGTTHHTIEKDRDIDIVVEGKDQIRGWFSSSFTTKYITKKKIFSKNILVHGFVLDDRGEKLSKTDKNYRKPNYYIKKYGNEIIKLHLLSMNFFKDIRINEENIKNTIRKYKKIRFIIRFMLLNISTKKNDKIIITKKIKKRNNKISEIDKYIINKLIKKIKKIKKTDKEFKYFKSIKIFEKYLFNYLSRIYFEVIKEKLYLLKRKSKKRISCQRTIFMLLRITIIILLPYISNTCEEAWSKIEPKESVFESKTIKLKKMKTKIKEKTWDKIIKMKNSVDKIISKSKIKKKNIMLKIYIKKPEIFKGISEYIINKIFKVNKCKIYKRKKNKIRIKVLKEYKKCIRCWNYYKKINKEKKCKKCNGINNKN